jgi:hypothetical protein
MIFEFLMMSSVIFVFTPIARFIFSNFPGPEGVSAPKYSASNKSISKEEHEKLLEKEIAELEREKLEVETDLLEAKTDLIEARMRR